MDTDVLAPGRGLASAGGKAKPARYPGLAAQPRCKLYGASDGTVKAIISAVSSAAMLHRRPGLPFGRITAIVESSFTVMLPQTQAAGK
jgi:hypothetical protein